MAAPLTPVGSPLEPNANAAEPEAAQPQLEALASARSIWDRLPALVSIRAEGMKCPKPDCYMLLQLNYSPAKAQAGQRIDLFTMSRRGLGAPRVSHETAPSRGRLGHMGQTLSTPVSIRPRLRHDVRPEPTGWTVYDATNGQTVCLDGTALIELAFEEADGLARLLNWQEREIQREARRRVLAAVPQGPARPTTPRVREAARARS